MDGGRRGPDERWLVLCLAYCVSGWHPLRNSGVHSTAALSDLLGLSLMEWQQVVSGVRDAKRPACEWVFFPSCFALRTPSTIPHSKFYHGGETETSPIQSFC